MDTRPHTHPHTCIRDVRDLLYMSCTQHSTPGTVRTSSSSPAAAVSLPVLPPVPGPKVALTPAPGAPEEPLEDPEAPAPDLAASFLAASSSKERWWQTGGGQNRG